jgi:hypothetical protein
VGAAYPALNALLGRLTDGEVRRMVFGAHHGLLNVGFSLGALARRRRHRGPGTLARHVSAYRDTAAAGSPGDPTPWLNSRASSSGCPLQRHPPAAKGRQAVRLDLTSEAVRLSPGKIVGHAASCAPDPNQGPLRRHPSQPWPGLEAGRRELVAWSVQHGPGLLRSPAVERER